MSKQRSPFLRYLYCTFGIAFLLYSTYIVFILVMHIWHHAPVPDISGETLSKEDRLYKEMIEGVDAQNAGVAYKDISEIHRLYNFHQAEAVVGTDTQNLCVSCHGDVPHNKKQEIRAFLNMHAFFMGCETCHITPSSPSGFKYVWYDKNTGEEFEKIDTGFFLDDTPYKLIPRNRSGEANVFDTPAVTKYVDEFKNSVSNAAPAAKSAALRVIHRPMNKLEDSVKCNDCHTPNLSEAYLPYKEIGYTERRLAQIVGNEVSGMIDNYKEFFLPNFLRPSEEQ